MKTTRVITTYKNGKLVGNKTVSSNDAKPVFSESLVATEAMQHSLNKTLSAFDEMAAELYSLRRQLIEAHREVKARTKERNGLRRAYAQQRRNIKKLENQKEDLQAKLFAAAEDLKYLEANAAQAAEAKHVVRPESESKQVNFKKPEKQTKPRSIAASPIKK